MEEIMILQSIILGVLSTMLFLYLSVTIDNAIWVNVLLLLLLSGLMGAIESSFVLIGLGAIFFTYLVVMPHGMTWVQLVLWLFAFASAGIGFQKYDQRQKTAR
jgi:hypothetical protein